MFSFAVDFLIDLDVWNDMRFCHIWGDTGRNILIGFDVPLGVGLVIKDLLTSNIDLASSPYTLPSILMEPVVDDFSVRAKLLSGKIKQKVEPVSSASICAAIHPQVIVDHY